MWCPASWILRIAWIAERLHGVREWRGACAKPLPCRGTVAAAGLWLCRVPCVVLMRGTSYLLFAAAVVVPVYCLVFWLLTGSYHPSTIAAFLLVEWLCVGVGVYMLRSVRSLDDYAK